MLLKKRTGWVPGVYECRTRDSEHNSDDVDTQTNIRFPILDSLTAKVNTFSI